MHEIYNLLYVLLEIWPWILLAVLGTLFFTGPLKGFFSSPLPPETASVHEEPVQERDFGNRDRERKVVLNFNLAGLPEDAELLGRLFADRDAVLDLLLDAPAKTQIQSKGMEPLVVATVKAAVHRAEDLLDYERRVHDPLLDVPEGALEEARRDIHAAYVALADTRTRVRRHLAADVSEAVNVLDYAPLRALVAKLEDQTEVAHRVESRMAELDDLDVH